MARVYNWQIGREMSYWYPESRPKRQFAAMFDINKCIACQTCTLACKTTWTSGKGQEYMLWNNVESKPYGFYPLAWDVKLLEKLGAQVETAAYEGRTLFEAAAAGRARAGVAARGAGLRLPQRRRGRLRRAGSRHGARLQVPHLNWFFYLARICNHCTYPACLASCPRGSIYKRPGGRHRARRPGPLPRLPGVRQGVPVQEGLLQPDDRAPRRSASPASRRSSRGCSRSASSTASARSASPASSRSPRTPDPDNPIDYLVHVRKVALPLFPQFGLEPNVYYIPPMHAPARSCGRCSARAWTRRSTRTARRRTTRTWPACSGLFGSTERVVPRWKRQGEMVIGLEEEGARDRPRADARAGARASGTATLLRNVVRMNTP